METRILVERDGPLAKVTMARAEKHNAFDMQMYEDFAEAVSGLGRDDSVRCVVIAGQGGRAFSVGSDIGMFSDDRAGSAGARVYAERTACAGDALLACPHPTIAKIGGYCVGGGLELAAACDLRICSDDSRFSIPANRLGLTLDYAELGQLVDLIGRRRTMELLLEGRMFGAEEALRLGLVSRVVPRDALDREVAEAAARIVEAAPLSNRWHKKFLRRLADPAPLTDQERAEPFEAFDTRDYLEGTAAFNAKRRPDFRGR